MNLIKNRTLHLKMSAIILTWSFLFLPYQIFASVYFAEFFVSNNTKTINIKKAYARLIGNAQDDLHDKLRNVLQKNHIEPGQFENILGTYRLLNNNRTGDNSEYFNTSPHQPLTDTQIFSIAKELAITLNQESIAVLIANQPTISHIIVKLRSQKPGINKIIRLIRNTLPALYNDAFSMHLMNTTEGFKHAKVWEIEWIGSKIDLEEIKKAFPLEKINYRHGTAFLVYQNGTIEHI